VAALKASTFKYQTRSKEAIQKRAEQKGGAFDSFIKDQFSIFVAKEGDHLLRFLPPTWEDADHYGFDAWLHYNIGADKQAYLCLEKHEQGTCPICEERRKVEKEDADYAKELAPKKRVLAWVINRDDESSGPIIYPMPWTLDRDIAVLSVDKRTKAALLIDHPTKGFDVEFKRTGAQRNTKYIGVAIARAQTELSGDQKQMGVWLNFIQENPLPDTLKFYEEDYIRTIFEGGGPSSSSEETKEDDIPETESPRKGKEDEDGDEVVIVEDEEEQKEEETTEEDLEEKAPAREEKKPTSHRSRLDDLRNRAKKK